MNSPALIRWRSLLVLLFSTLSACHFQIPETNQPTSSLSVQASNTDPACKVVNHAWGKTELCEQPQRIIALDPHALDLLLSLNIQPIGYSEDSRALVGNPKLGQSVNGVKYLGDRLRSSPTHVGTWQTPSLETMLGLKPDLILSGYLDESQYKNFSQLAPTLIPIDDWTSPKQWQDSLLLLGQILDRETQAQQAIDAYNRNVISTKNELIQTGRQNVLLLSMTGLDDVGIFNHKTFAGAILEDLGFELLVPNELSETNGEIVISLETLPQLRPDLIIVMASGDSQVDQVKSVWEGNSVLRSLPAYQNDQVYFVDYHLWSRIQGAIAAELVIAQVREMLLNTKSVSAR
ncbi:MAG: iron-siderophore ABC transporter substrate-binding protein [Timaviella obliquedivisa GSE-PSE-MK23-08B]|jgi:iron complex transport system substrate-binding protein|nr:iron-siderophore ABC transporter substrate-binding protein [Timaviella obliquedivisa GSE-PSE-MK23-08B]